METVAPRAHGVAHAVELVRELGGNAFVVRAARNGMQFEPGQYITVGLFGRIDAREYSVYSAPQDGFLEILVKEVDDGYVSPQLHSVRPGDILAIDGPFGYFTIDPEARDNRKFLLVATGTGISPFRSFVRAYPKLDYTLLHGVRFREETYEADGYDPARYLSCVSRGDGGDFSGRVTDFLRQSPVAPDTLCYLCGNCDMIYEAFDILKEQGVPPEQLFAEVYF